VHAHRGEHAWHRERGAHCQEQRGIDQFDRFAGEQIGCDGAERQRQLVDRHVARAGGQQAPQCLLEGGIAGGRRRQRQAVAMQAEFDARRQ
jgi:hypothetical protein